MINKTIIFLKKQKIFIFLVLAVLILLVLKIYFQKKEPKVEYEKKPLPLEKEVDITKEKAPFASEKEKENLKAPSSSSVKRPTETEGTEEDTRQTLKLYPLIEYLPIDNKKYHLTYTDPFELTITVKEGNEEEIKKEIIGWIISKNIDPSTHKIIFQ